MLHPIFGEIEYLPSSKKLQVKTNKLDEFHQTWISFLKEEHLAKMRILQLEEKMLEKRQQNFKENEAVLENLEILSRKYSAV